MLNAFVAKLLAFSRGKNRKQKSDFFICFFLNISMAFSLETIVAWAKRRGFAYPGSEIYGGLANARDL